MIGWLLNTRAGPVAVAARLRELRPVRVKRFDPETFLLALWLRLWRWVAVFACARLNARLWDEQHTYVVTQTGEPRG